MEAWNNRNGISPDDERLKLIIVSASNLERALTPYRVLDESSTKESREQSMTQLKQSTPYVDRRCRPEKPGSLSIDTVAHCQGDLSGNLVWTLTLADELTHWTQNRATGRRMCNRRAVQEHLGNVRFDDEGIARLLARFYHDST